MRKADAVSGPLLPWADPAAVENAAADLERAARSHRRSARDLVAGLPNEQIWSGAAKDAFHASVDGDAERLLAGALACDAGAHAFRTYAQVLRLGQQRADEARQCYLSAQDLCRRQTQLLQSAGSSAQAVAELVNAISGTLQVAQNAVGAWDEAERQLEAAAQRLDEDLREAATLFSTATPRPTPSPVATSTAPAAAAQDTPFVTYQPGVLEGLEAAAAARRDQIDGTGRTPARPAASGTAAPAPLAPDAVDPQATSTFVYVPVGKPMTLAQDALISLGERLGIWTPGSVSAVEAQLGVRINAYPGTDRLQIQPRLAVFYNGMPTGTVFHELAPGVPSTPGVNDAHLIVSLGAEANHDAVGVWADAGVDGDGNLSFSPALLYFRNMNGVGPAGVLSPDNSNWVSGGIANNVKVSPGLFGGVVLGAGVTVDSATVTKAWVAARDKVSQIVHSSPLLSVALAPPAPQSWPAWPQQSPSQSAPPGAPH